jgi:hypothetical protein
MATPQTFDKDQFNAYTTRHITMMLLYGLFALVIGIVIAAFLPNVSVNDKIVALVSPIITGIFGLASGAVGYWIAKQRLPVPDPSTTTITTHTVSTPTPMVVPKGSEIVSAPPPPAAIISTPSVPQPPESPV